MPKIILPAIWIIDRDKFVALAKEKGMPVHLAMSFRADWAPSSRAPGRLVYSGMLESVATIENCWSSEGRAYKYAERQPLFPLREPTDVSLEDALKDNGIDVVVDRSNAVEWQPEP